MIWTNKSIIFMKELLLESEAYFQSPFELTVEKNLEKILEKRTYTKMVEPDETPAESEPSPVLETCPEQVLKEEDMEKVEEKEKEEDLEKTPESKVQCLPSAEDVDSVNLETPIVSNEVSKESEKEGPVDEDKEVEISLESEEPKESATARLIRSINEESFAAESLEQSLEFSKMTAYFELVNPDPNYDSSEEIIETPKPVLRSEDVAEMVREMVENVCEYENEMEEDSSELLGESEMSGSGGLNLLQEHLNDLLIWNEDILIKERMLSSYDDSLKSRMVGSLSMVSEVTEIQESIVKEFEFDEKASDGDSDIRSRGYKEIDNLTRGGFGRYK